MKINHSFIKIIFILASCVLVLSLSKEIIIYSILYQLSSTIFFIILWLGAVLTLLYSSKIYYCLFIKCIIYNSFIYISINFNCMFSYLGSNLVFNEIEYFIYLNIWLLSIFVLLLFYFILLNVCLLFLNTVYYNYSSIELLITLLSIMLLLFIMISLLM